MRTVKIKSGNKEVTVHGEKEKISSGQIVKGINAIDSFTFSILPNNIGFDLINEFTTLVEVYNTRKNKYDFIGRVLHPEDEMSEDGAISKTVVCESLFGYLCDSQQPYVDTQNWTVDGLLRHLIDCHNSQVEEYKRFAVGEVTVTDKNDNLYVGISRQNTWESIHSNLIDKLGGELQYRVVDDVIYIDYLEKIGETRATEIALSVNMKSIVRTKDPSAFITRLIPLGAKLADDTEERLDITSVNNGLNYIDDTNAINRYGIHVGYVEFDNVNTASVLLSRGRNWLAENNKVQIKYSISALDLSLLGLSIDDFEIHDYYPIKNALIGVDDIARIIKQTIDVCDETSSSIEVGDNLKTLSDIDLEQAKKYEAALKQSESELKATIENSINETAARFETVIEEQQTSAVMSCEALIFAALETYTQTGDFEAFKEAVEAQLAILASEIVMNFSTTTEQITNIDGDLQTKFNEVYKHISFSENGISISAGDNSISLVLDNDRISFQKDGLEFGHWDGQNFHTGNIVVSVEEKAQFGNFAFVPRSDGSLQFLKVGG